jgi:glycosyltransferase involved in cell wall biosynthesis
MQVPQVKAIHLIAFDIPVPVNYGGAIDIFYKIKALKALGIGVYLHCFQYGRETSALLESLCLEVYYYPRNISKTQLFNRRPYIVATRSNENLTQRLLRDELPILIEGLHCCHYLEEARLKKRKRIVRMHNIEHHYYASLAKVERNIFKRYYFYNEAYKLRRYEQVLHKASGIAAISHNDQAHFQEHYSNVQTISAFHPHETVDILPGRGEYALYHASLDVGENNEAALYLTREVFKDGSIPLVIAGNKPSRELREAVNVNPRVSFRLGLDSEGITELVKNAQINILPTFQATGIKLKLLLALYVGRFCIVNTPMVCQTGLEELCIVKDGAAPMKAAVSQYYHRDFPEEEILKRRRILMENGFSNRYNAEKLAAMLFDQ